MQKVLKPQSEVFFSKQEPHTQLICSDCTGSQVFFLRLFTQQCQYDIMPGAADTVKGRGHCRSQNGITIERSLYYISVLDKKA